MKTEVVNARIEPALKASAEKIFRSLGMKTTDAISIFLSQVVLNKGLPFDVRIPNKATLKAIKEVKTGKGKRYKTSKQMVDDLLS
ncbi:MAG: type II toxin-antitoxin system RelB/DinJ family antitoxin [Alphaproteobacteria bacterium]|nr:type II toxin-antitoxin system RelB/DinJ family antitoxin [Alphaproteobacteria bacterium]